MTTKVLPIMRFDRRLNQRGRGLGKILKSGFQLIKQFLFPSLAKAAKSSIGKKIANEAGSVLAGVAADSISGKASIKESGQARLENSLRKISKKLKQVKKVKKRKFGGSHSSFFDA